MDLDPALLARAQFSADITFHILFPTITIALAWLLLFKVRYNATGKSHWMQTPAGFEMIDGNAVVTEQMGGNGSLVAPTWNVRA